MSDKKLVESILKVCNDEWKGNLTYHIDPEYYVIFNDKDQCIFLDLSDSGLIEIPEEIYKLKHLTYLDLRFNNINTIPKSLYDSIDEVLIDN